MVREPGRETRLSGAERTFSGALAYVDADLEVVVLGAELAGSFADDPNTHLHRWVTANRQPVRDLDSARKARQAVYPGDRGKQRYDQDAHPRHDDNLPESEKILRAPAGLSNRERANSRDENQLSLQRGRAANAGKPRTFIRTWVRLVRKDSDELT